MPIGIPRYARNSEAQSEFRNARGLHHKFSGLAGDGVLEFFQLVFHLVQAVDQLFEIVGHAAEEGCYFGVLEMLELRNDEVTLFAGTDKIYEAFQPGTAQTALVQALREHPGEEQRVIANVLAHLALVIKRRRGAIDGVGFQQHFSYVAETAAITISDLVQSFGLAKLGEKIGHVTVDFRTAYPHFSVIALYNFLKELP